MDITIPKSLEALVRRKVDEGHYSTEDEVVADALRLMHGGSARYHQRTPRRHRCQPQTRRPQAGAAIATNGRHCVFFEADQSRILVVRVLHDRMDYQRHLDADAGPDRDR